MSYILKHLNSKDELIEEFKVHPENIKHYEKYYAFDGPTESIDYLLKKLNRIR